MFYRCFIAGSYPSETKETSKDIDKLTVQFVPSREPDEIITVTEPLKDMLKDELAKEGISCEIIDLRTVRPMDYDAIINSVKKTNRLVVLEEAWPFASVASEITYMVQERAFDYLDAPIQRITTADTPAPYSPTLLKEWLPNSEDVIKAVKKVTYK